MGYIAGILVGGVVSFAFAPIALAIAVSVYVGFRLDALDDQYKLTDKLIAVLEKLGQDLTEKQEQMQKTLSRAPHEIERNIIWRTLGMDIDNLLP